MSDATGSAAHDRREVWLWFLIWIAAQVCFLNTAFRIDEPNIIAIARQIAREPLDPYGFDINWLGRPQPAFEILSNPPLVPAWLALWASAFGWSEVSLHLSVLPFAGLAVFAMASLAKDFRISRPAASAMLAFSPAFFLGAQVVMPDVAMLSALLLAVAAAARWSSEGSPGWLAAGIVAAASAPLLKYNGLIVVPVLAWLAWNAPRGRRAGAWAIAAAPLGGLLLFGLASWIVYGQAHFLAAAGFQDQTDADRMSGILAATGLGVLPLGMILMRRPARLPRAHDAFIAAFAGVVFLAEARFLLQYPWISAVLFGISSAVAARFLLLILIEGVDGAGRRDAISILLAVWVAVTIAFQFRLLFTSVRYLLPLLPAAVIYALRRWSLPPTLTRSLIAATAALTLTIAVGDARTANLYRLFIGETVAPLVSETGGTFYFSGHWGFQYYAEAIGGQSLEEGRQPDLAPGDVIAIARNAFPPVEKIEPREGIAIRSRGYVGMIHWVVHTIDCWAEANFYSNGIGSCHRPRSTTFLPFGLSRRPVERLDLYLAEHADP
jgi:4-amino-4-deoxy-L-arabinose transferase-like glycosyltransferase